MGGGATIGSASNATAIADYDIRVAVAQHPAPCTGCNPKVPILYMTGDADTVVKPAGVLASYTFGKRTRKQSALPFRARSVSYSSASFMTDCFFSFIFKQLTEWRRALSKTTETRTSMRAAGAGSLGSVRWATGARRTDRSVATAPVRIMRMPM